MSNIRRQLLAAAGVAFLGWLPVFSPSSEAAETPEISVRETGQGLFQFDAAPSELSGLTWKGGADYLAVSDAGKSRGLFPLKIVIHPDTGFVESVTPGPKVAISAGTDLEGVAYAPDRGIVYVADEWASAIRMYSPSGKALGNVPVPKVFAKVRKNLGFESLSYADGMLWVTTEQALPHESQSASATEGSIVRMQRFDSTGRAKGQWAYQVDSHGGAAFLSGRETSGVSDLCALPGGQLLVMERAVGGGGPLPTMRIRLYLIDPSDSAGSATDTSRLPDLNTATFEPVAKRLAWERNFGVSPACNFEAIALGPTLADASRSLLLLADNSGGEKQVLLALRISGLPKSAKPQPSTPVKSTKKPGKK